jgi:hypothetical protein
MLSMFEVAREFEISPADVSGLETGSRTLSDEEWALVIGWCKAEVGGDIFNEPWEHRKEPLPEGRLKSIGEALEPGEVLAASQGHKKTLRVCRELHDEVMRLRGQPAATAWTVRVEKTELGYVSMFSVDVQSFILARDSDGDELEHCQFIIKRFQEAMSKVGAPPPTYAHRYPGAEWSRGFRTTDCGFGCGAWMGFEKSGGPEGVDPFGKCPAAEAGAVYDATHKLHGEPR